VKNIQIIDGANNCTYSVFAATDEEFAVIFPDGADIEFIEDFVERFGEEAAGRITGAIWDANERSLANGRLGSGHCRPMALIRLVQDIFRSLICLAAERTTVDQNSPAGR
jgi:plasmid stabilization system protein ParE